MHARESQLLQQIKQSREMSMEQLMGLGEEKVSAEQRFKQSADSAQNMLRQMYEDLRG